MKRYNPPPPVSWGVLSRSLFESHFSKQRSSRTSKSALDQATNWLTEERDAASIDRTTLREFVAHLRTLGDSEATVRRKVGIVLKVLREAHKDGLLPSVPAAPLLPPPKQGRVRWLSLDEEKILLDCLPYDYELLVRFLVDTGLRLGEALDLKWSEVTENQITVLKSKNDLRRTIPLTQRAVGVMGDRRTWGVPGGPFGNMDSWSVHRAWNKARAAMCLQNDPEFVPHCLRHTFASRLVQRGATLQMVQALLGHKKIEHTLIYAHLAPEQYTAAINLLEPVTQTESPREQASIP